MPSKPATPSLSSAFDMDDDLPTDPGVEPFPGTVPAEGHGRAARVLVADDDDDLRALVVATLRADGYEVSEVGDGTELLEYLRDAFDGLGTVPDIVVTDVRMPTLSGLGVLSALRRAKVSMPVVVMTVFADASVRTLATRLGAVGLLKKPFDMDDLRTIILNARTMHTRKEHA